MARWELSDRGIKLPPMDVEPAWKRRSVPRTTCDQCGQDYADEPSLCRTVTVITHHLYSETICANCASQLGITGYPVVLGTQPPPPGWPHPQPSPAQILDWLSSGGFRLPVEAPLTPINVERELLRVAELYAKSTD